jgi:hypothetical protein
MQLGHFATVNRLTAISVTRNFALRPPLSKQGFAFDRQLCAAVA